MKYFLNEHYWLTRNTYIFPVQRKLNYTIAVQKNTNSHANKILPALVNKGLLLFKNSESMAID